MKIIFYIFTISILGNFTYGQTNSFKIEEKFTTFERAKQISDSTKLPILITEKYVFSVGESCAKNFIAGIVNDRNFDGSNNDRFKQGNNNDRLKEGDNNERNKGGATAERIKKGKKNNRNKDGDENDRDNDGDINDRNKDGNNNDRNSNGEISSGPYCSNTKKGKLLLYSRQEINSKKSYIYFENQTFNNKYFKITKL